MAERRPYPFLTPGIDAFQTPVRHAYVAGLLYAAFGHLTKKIKTDTSNMAPLLKQPKYSRSNQLQRTKKAKTKTFKSKVKKSILDMSANYHCTIPDTTGAVAIMDHNIIYSLNLTAFIGQGVTNVSRQGDEIFLAACKLRGSLYSDSASSGYQYRMLVGWSGEDYTLVSLASTGLVYSEIFLPTSGTTNICNAIVNPKAFTCLYDTTIVLNSQLATTRELTAFAETISIQQKFAYQSSASALGKTKNLFFVIIPYKTLGVTDNDCGGVNVAFDLIFKNM